MANKFAKNDDAVSAVIGVILMVAITVILAAVIAAFVFGMGSSIKKTYVVSFTIERTSSGDVIVTNTGGPDVSSLKTVTVSYGGATYSGSSPSSDTLATVVGTTADLGATVPAQTHVTVTGLFKDGSSQVLASGDY